MSGMFKSKEGGLVSLKEKKGCNDNNNFVTVIVIHWSDHSVGTHIVDTKFCRILFSHSLTFLQSGVMPQFYNKSIILKKGGGGGHPPTKMANFWRRTVVLACKGCATTGSLG